MNLSSKVTVLIGCLALVGAGENLGLAQLQRTFGADISYWNCGTSSTGISQNNWDNAYSVGGVEFVWIRATRGGTTGIDQSQGTPGNPSGATLSRRYDDSRFTQNLSRAVLAGMLVGSYHFGRPDIVGNTGTDEANHFLQMAGPWMRPGHMMPVFDLEAGSGRGGEFLAQFSIDFSTRIYEVMQIRPAIYINGNYSSILQGASASLRNQLAQPPSQTPSVVSPAYPMVWDARYTDIVDHTDPAIQTGSPKTIPSTSSLYYGPWDDYGDSAPWSFWQFESTVSIPGFNAVDSTCDANVSQGDLQYVLNYLVPAVWWHDGNGNWGTLTNWNSGQPVVNPVTPPDQTTPYFGTNAPMPVPRLPGISSTNMTSGIYDTVILERPNANVTVTLSSGTYNIRKLYVRETLTITGGSLTVNYDPTYRPDDSPNVLHGGPISAQFSGPVTLSNGVFAVHTLQVDANQIFTLGGGTLRLNTIFLKPDSTTPAKILLTNNLAINALNNAAANISNGTGGGTSGRIDLGGAMRTVSTANGTSDVDLSINVPVINGGLTKSGSGTLRLSVANTYTGGTVVSAGRLMVSNPTGSGTGTGTVTVNSPAILCGTGRITGAVTISSGATLAPGTTTNLGTLTLTTAPTFNGTNLMRVNWNGGSPQSDRVTLTTGTLTYGGRLVVTNAGATLTGGEAFTLFSAPSYAGTFASTSLPALGAGLNWFTGSLVTNGTIRVNRRPVITTTLNFTNTAPAVLQIPFSTLVGSATDADGNAMKVSAITLVTTNGTTLTTNSTTIFYSYHKSVNDQFGYTISDGQGGEVSGVVNIKNIGSTPVSQFSTVPTTNGNSVVLNIQGTPAWTYFTHRSTNLVGWSPIATNVAPPNGSFNVIDTFSDLPARPPRAYYRVRSENQ